jgi:transcription elongation factor Elf1
MKLYPWGVVLEQVDKLIMRGADVYQQFNCEHCGAKQTMDKPNIVYETGTCEECGKLTDIKQRGMNYMVHAGAGVTT